MPDFASLSQKGFNACIITSGLISDNDALDLAPGLTGFA
jgi:hypothetical protein